MPRGDSLYNKFIVCLFFLNLKFNIILISLVIWFFNQQKAHEKEKIKFTRIRAVTAAKSKKEQQQRKRGNHIRTSQNKDITHVTKRTAGSWHQIKDNSYMHIQSPSSLSLYHFQSLVSFSPSFTKFQSIILQTCQGLSLPRASLMLFSLLRNLIAPLFTWLHLFS